MPTRQRTVQPDTTLTRRRLGKALREAREASGYSLALLADGLEGFSKSALSRLERGETEKIKPIEVEYIARFLQMPEERSA
ncbi:helix-turn-helix domain-containing protein [Nocardia miyunensis]|uniref:helix-turn-helix domain-containing protein n=1 Tax=Nocardia miyunensis TaxID=282684 RepID=UPI000835671F